MKKICLLIFIVVLSVLLIGCEKSKALKIKDVIWKCEELKLEVNDDQLYNNMHHTVDECDEA